MMPTLTAFLRIFEKGVTEKFMNFLKQTAGADDVRVSHVQTHAWFRFESRMGTVELEKAAREAGFNADFFDTKHEEGVS